MEEWRILAQGFRGFSPWSIDPVALGLWQHRTSCDRGRLFVSWQLGSKNRNPEKGWGLKPLQGCICSDLTSFTRPHSYSVWPPSSPTGWPPSLYPWAFRRHFRPSSSVITDYSSELICSPLRAGSCSYFSFHSSPFLAACLTFSTFLINGASVALLAYMLRMKVGLPCACVSSLCSCYRERRFLFCFKQQRLDH